MKYLLIVLSIAFASCTQKKGFYVVGESGNNIAVYVSDTSMIEDHAFISEHVFDSIKSNSDKRSINIWIYDFHFKQSKNPEFAGAYARYAYLDGQLSDFWKLPVDWESYGSNPNQELPNKEFKFELGRWGQRYNNNAFTVFVYTDSRDSVKTFYFDKFINGDRVQGEATTIVDSTSEYYVFTLPYSRVEINKKDQSMFWYKNSAGKPYQYKRIN